MSSFLYNAFWRSKLHNYSVGGKNIQSPLFFFFRENVSIAPHPYFPWTLIFRNWIMFDLANASHG